ncbi:hypothetical protein [Promicromonospora umidemergens]|nr:hypothetical protein [Promicromonospora umidemergens]
MATLVTAVAGGERDHRGHVRQVVHSRLCDTVRDVPHRVMLLT